MSMSSTFCKDFHDDGSVADRAFGHQSNYDPSEVELPNTTVVGDIRKKVAGGLYVKTIRLFEQAIRLQLELATAQTNLDVWRRTQLSSQFHRASRATRTILDVQRTEYAQALSDIKKRLSHTLVSLSTLPDLATHAKHLSDEVDGRELKRYILEMDEWIRSARLASEFMSSCGVQTQHEDGPKHWTWDQLKASTNILETLSENLVETLYLRRFTTISTCSKTTGFVGVDEASQFRSPSHMNQVAGNSLKLEAEYLRGIRAIITERLVQGQIELEQLNIKLKDVERAQEQTRTYLQECEQKQKDDAATIEDLTKLLEQLKALPRPSAHVPEGLLKAIRKLVSNELETNIISRLGELFKDACRRNNLLMLEQLEPIEDLTTIIRRGAEISQKR